MGRQTPHEILGVPSDATPEQITRAFRKLAVKYHPDKRADDGRYATIREAYESLKNAKPTANQTPPAGIGNDLRITISVPLSAVAEGRTKTIHYVKKIPCGSCHKIVCGSCGGTGRNPVSLVMGPKKPCKKCQGSGKVRSHKGCTACGGKGFFEKKTAVSIDLHPLMGGPVVLKGHGNETESGKGDLIVEIFVEKDQTYQASGLNLKRKLVVSPAQVIIGDTVDLDVFGRGVVVQIPFGTVDGQTIRKPKAGLSYSGRTGDLIIEIVIKVPVVVSAKERDLYTQILKIEKEASCQNL